MHKLSILIWVIAAGILSCLGILLLAKDAKAQTAVTIHDAGGAVPSAQYLAQLLTIDPDDSTTLPSGVALISFPIRTPDMAPGVLKQSSQIAQPDWLTHPLFLIGSDKLSQTWLKEHLTQLLNIGAFGIVVDVDNYASFRSLQQTAAGLPLAPASGTGLLPGFTVYPLLINSNGEVTQ